MFVCANVSFRRTNHFHQLHNLCFAFVLLFAGEHDLHFANSPFYLCLALQCLLASFSLSLFYPVNMLLLPRVCSYSCCQNLPERLDVQRYSESISSCLLYLITIFLTGAGMSATKGSPAKSGWSGGGMLKFFFYIFLCSLLKIVY